jgi:hypothetical protein
MSRREFANLKELQDFARRNRSCTHWKRRPSSPNVNGGCRQSHDQDPKPTSRTSRKRRHLTRLRLCRAEQLRAVRSCCRIALCRVAEAESPA